MQPRLLQPREALRTCLPEGSGRRVTVSLKKMSAGDGYRYLLRTVAVGDGDRSLSAPLTRYYTEAGTPPGRWIGTGVASLDSPIRAGDVVTEEQLRLLIGQGRHPGTGDHLGRPYRVFQRLPDGARRQPVAGFDLTFSVPKSASVLWAVADPSTQAGIAEAHHAAVAQVLDFLEREVLATRAGAKGAAGAVAQYDVTGLVAAGFDHYDSRANDPHLHTHVVISNRVKTTVDGAWRTVDGAPLHAWVVALSELHQGLVSDHLTRTLGVGWERRPRGRDRNPGWEITGVPQGLVEELSGRARQIELATDRLITQYITEHGHRPRAATIMKLRAQATLTTRPDKQVHSLADLTTAWRQRAGEYLGEDATEWAHGLLASTPGPGLVRAEQVPVPLVEDLGRAVVEAVAEKRSTWRRPNLYAEAARQMLGWRFATDTDREAVTGMVADAAEHASLRLTPPDMAATPAVFTRPDGSSAFRPRHAAAFTCEELLAAEARLLDRAQARTGPTITPTAVGCHGAGLSAVQARALGSIAGSGRVVDLLVGPAGAGKTTALRALRDAWAVEHGRGSVVGLASSAAAAQVLADDLDTACETTAKWLYEHQQGRTVLRPGQLVIIDEATLAGTLSLDRLTAHAAEQGAKVLLVGDHAQLQAVEAGGAFALLAAARDDAPELVDVHRFTQPWERAASLDLRHGHPAAADAYQAHGRIRAGDPEAMLEAAYQAWRTDTEAGLASVLVADSTAAAQALNQRARAERILTGHTHTGAEAELVDGARASAGDLVITRRNDRRLLTGRGGWVRNGDRWQVTHVRADGSLHVRRHHPDGRRRGRTVTLPADYVGEHVDLGYAVTAHRAQGLTVDTAHAYATEATTRENLYVALTRGRHANTAYLAQYDDTDDTDDRPHTPRPTPSDNTTAEQARQVLLKILASTGAEQSATQTLQAEQDTWASIAQLAGEYQTIAATAQRDRWTRLLRGSLPADLAEQALASEAFGPLAAELGRAEATGHPVETLLPRLVTRHGLDDAHDIAAVLRHRLTLATTNTSIPDGARGSRRRFIAGLIPEARGPMANDLRVALDERATLIEDRARALAEQAVRTKAPWVKRIGPPPTDPADRERWMRALVTLAAYRDRHAITTTTPLGNQPTSDNQRHDRARAHAALRDAQQTGANSSRAAPQRHVSPTLGL